MQQSFIENEISGLHYDNLSGYNIHYSAILPFWLSIIFQLPRVIKSISIENRWVAAYCNQHHPDVVISDNRYGFRTKSAYSIFITHQVNIRAGIFTPLINLWNKKQITKFNFCWIPDFEDSNVSLAGSLSHPKMEIPHCQYIGLLSRFSSDKRNKEKTIDLLILLSGPEPQRGLFEKLLIVNFESYKGSVTLICGGNYPPLAIQPNNWIVKDLLCSQDLESLLLSARKIICRSGYSTLMDLHCLGLKALLIPTPGQTEQEYLAEYWEKHFQFRKLAQRELPLRNLLSLIPENV